jgi:hypothetical protein
MRYFKLLILFVLVGFTISCKKRGCTDPDALNYVDTANKDDHSCYYFWIGQRYGGGKVFYIDKTKKHGLIAAEFDLAPMGWGCFGTQIGNTDSIVGSGNQNSINIFEACGDSTAAALCNKFDTLGYDDWYLPSIEELSGLYKGLGELNEANFGSGYYWSSSEVDAYSAKLVLFANGAKTVNAKHIGYSVRPIRKF